MHTFFRSVVLPPGRGRRRGLYGPGGLIQTSSEQITHQALALVPRRRRCPTTSGRSIPRNFCHILGSRVVTKLHISRASAQVTTRGLARLRIQAVRGVLATTSDRLESYAAGCAALSADLATPNSLA